MTICEYRATLLHQIINGWQQRHPIMDDKCGDDNASVAAHANPTCDQHTASLVYQDVISYYVLLLGAEVLLLLVRAEYKPYNGHSNNARANAARSRGRGIRRYTDGGLMSMKVFVTSKQLVGVF